MTDFQMAMESCISLTYMDGYILNEKIEINLDYYSYELCLNCARQGQKDSNNSKQNQKSN